MPLIPIISALVILFARLIRSLRLALQDAETRGLVYLVAIAIGTGTVFYRLVEGWGWVDSLYFTVITLTTVGYGDLHPTTPLSKLFTTVYILLGLGILGAFITVLTQKQRDMVRERRQRAESDEVETNE